MDVTTSRRLPTLATAAATAAGLLAAGLVGTAPAAHAAPAASRISLHASDHEVDPGEQFVLRGRFFSEGRPVAGVPVKVRTWRGGPFEGGWRDVAGAEVVTRSDGRYRIRVILHSGGDRDLRVVGNPAGDRVATARNETVVRVLG